MLGIGFFAGLVVGFGLSVWLFRIYLRRHPREVASVEAAPPAVAATAKVDPIGSAAPAEVSIPMDIVEQLQEHLQRLEVLERRESMRVVRRKARTPLIKH